MKKGMSNNSSKFSALCDLREKYLPYNEITLRRLALATTLMYALILLWALILKCCSETELVTNYYNLRNMTLKDRILWDFIPFNYRGTGIYRTRLIINTILNCFVLSPLGVTLCYVFKKKNHLRNLLLCFGFSLFVESLQTLTCWSNPSFEDLLANSAGYFIGLAVFHLIFKRLTVKQGVRFFALTSAFLAAGVIFALVSAVNTSELILKMITKTL